MNARPRLIPAITLPASSNGRDGIAAAAVTTKSSAVTIRRPRIPALCEFSERHTSWVSTAGDVETVTGLPPASFEAFARRNAVAWTSPEDK